MCGIITLLNSEKHFNQNISKLLRSMFYVNSLRGDDSTGLAVEDKGGCRTYKSIASGPDFIWQSEPSKIIRDYEKTKMIIGHHRAATIGNITVDTAHPFIFNHITGVHNGTLRGIYEQLVPEAVHEVDSQYLYDSISRYGSEATLKKAQGAMCLVWHDTTDNTCHILRNNERPFSIYRVKNRNTLIGASEGEMIKYLAGRKAHTVDVEPFLDPVVGTEYIFDLDGDILTPQKIPRTMYHYTPPASNYASRTNNNNSNRSTITYPHKTKALPEPPKKLPNNLGDFQFSRRERRAIDQDEPVTGFKKPRIIALAKQVEIVFRVVAIKEKVMSSRKCIGQILSSSTLGSTEGAKGKTVVVYTPMREPLIIGEVYSGYTTYYSIDTGRYPIIFRSVKTNNPENNVVSIIPKKKDYSSEIDILAEEVKRSEEELKKLEGDINNTHVCCSDCGDRTLLRDCVVTDDNLMVCENCLELLGVSPV